MRATWISVGLISTFLLGACSSDDDDGDGSPSPDAGPLVLQSRQCERYIECVEAVSPSDVNAAIVGFGQASSCWDDRDRALECTDDCENGLRLLGESHPKLLDCAPCEDDIDCGDTSAPYCDSSFGTCVFCLFDEHCAESEAPFCRESGGCSAYECDSELDCFEGEVCNFGDDGSRCGPCTEDFQCPFEAPFCGDSGICAACLDDTQCFDGFFCIDPGTDIALCGQCRDSNDCPDGLLCDDLSHVCF